MAALRAHTFAARARTPALTTTCATTLTAPSTLASLAATASATAAASRSSSSHHYLLVQLVSSAKAPSTTRTPASRHRVRTIGQTIFLPGLNHGIEFTGNKWDYFNPSSSDQRK
jgi:hypothetical protein